MAMAVPNPNNPPSLTSLMSQNQLIDSLTSHISLYHSLSSAPASSTPNPRSSILKWFSSLSVHQRQAHLTVVDANFTQILIQMLGKLRTQGHGFFIILPDLPSSSSSSSTSSRHFLPSLCFKKSHGLLSRFAQSHEPEQLIFKSTLLFNSNEGENVSDSCSVNCLDSVTVSEGFVQNLDLFVDTMDRVSNGEFLRGEESQLGSNWVEFGWLKAKGHYSMEAFVANRLEVALRLSWLNSTSGKKRGVKLKEKMNLAGVAANVYWRKKGCLDWWVNLDVVVKRKVLTAILGKSAKTLTHEILKRASNASKDELWLFNVGVGQQLRYNHTVSSQKTMLTLTPDAEFGSTVTLLSGRPNSFANVCNSIFVLQDIITMILSCLHSEYDKEKLFFSTMASVSTISDCILRTLRGFLMVISLDCTKLELLEEGKCKSLPNKSKEKSGASSRKKKGRARNTKKINSVPKSCADEFSYNKPHKVLDCALDLKGKTHLSESNNMLNIPKGEEIYGETSLSTVEMERAQRVGFGKSQNTARKNRKDKSKIKNNSFDNTVEVRNDARPVAVASSSFVISHEETAKSITDCSLTHNVGNDNSTVIHTFALDSRQSSSATVPSREDNDTHRGHGDSVVSSTNAFCKVLTPAMPGREPDNVLSNDTDVQASIPSPTDDKSAMSGESTKCVNITKDPKMIQGQKGGNFCDITGSTTSSEYLSYEWPNVASVYIPSINSHLPAATDRLHLDVGSNWHNHFRHSFVSTVHQTRNAPIEGRCKQILSRPLPMSLDWPPMVRSACRLVPSVACNYESGFIPRRQSTFQQGFTAHGRQLNAAISDDDRKYSGDFIDLPDSGNSQEFADEGDGHWISEEEFEVHPVSGLDYNQYFGGGVMYWNPSDHLGAGYSRPPSLSSDDSSWAWREADMNRTVDDMVAFSSSYSTNGLTSPTAASFCSSFDPLVSGHQALGYVVPGNEVSGKVLHPSSTIPDAASEEEVSGSLANLPGDEGKTGDSFPYPILRPIIIPNMSRERSRSEFKRGHDHKSPCVPTTRREQPRIKRPPSPVVLCVPRAPCPPPPSPVSDSRKHRGFSTVRSGSSSPRHWGMRYHDATNWEEAYVRMDGTEVVWPSWRNKNLSTRPMIQPLPAALLQDRLIAISQLARDQEHPDVAFRLQPPELENHPAKKTSLLLMHSLLHDEIDSFCKQVASENMARKPYINWAVKRVTRSLQVLWPRSRTNIFGSNATGLSLPTSDVDLVVCLPPVRNLEPIKEAGILEGRNGIKETCLQHAARYLANQEWVKSDSVKTVENTTIPIIMLVVEVPHDLITSAASVVQSPQEKPNFMTGEQCNLVQSDVLEDSDLPKSSQVNYDNTKDPKSFRLDISFKSPSHTGLQTTELVKELTEQFPAATPLALVLKQFLADRSLDQSYSGGLSSYCLMLLITRFLQHEHHLGRPINQNFGSLLMDFLYFFGNVFDPRQMRISVQGSGVYINREGGYSIDPIHIDDPLFPTNNVGRNCFRIHQCIKAFSEAYSTLENELVHLPNNGDACSKPLNRLLPKIIPSINLS